jgi:hydrogenase expression/formation protein HypC
VEFEGNAATVDVMGNQREADLTLIEDPQVGDYVLLHAGFAIEKMTAEDAAESLRIWEELGNVQFEG